MRGEAFSLIRFVDLDHSRLYNCTVCKWWLDFLAHAAVYVLPNHKPKHNKFVRQLAYQRRQNSASLTTLVMCKPKVLKSILLEGAKKSSKTAQAIANDYRAVQYLRRSSSESIRKILRSLTVLSSGSSSRVLQKPIRKSLRSLLIRLWICFVTALLSFWELVGERLNSDYIRNSAPMLSMLVSCMRSSRVSSLELSV